MLEDNIKIALSLENPFNYTDYNNLCIKYFHTPMPFHFYFQKMGLVKGAICMFPNLSTDEAYDSLIDLMNKSIKNNPEKKCGGCSKNEISDGGKVV